jgi:hypothetical protein
MNYFLLKSDFDWCWKNGVECYAESLWRMPGIYCPAHSKVSTYIDGLSYPAADFKDPQLKRCLQWGDLHSTDEELEWYEQWKQPEKWRALRQKLIRTLPYEVAITPGTSFGPTTVELSGKPADFHFSFLQNNLLLAQSALEKLRTRQIRDIFATPCIIKSKRKRETYYEIQVEHLVELAGDLDTSEQESRIKRGLPIKCAECGKEWGRLPKEIILKGSSIPHGHNLFRLKNQPTSLFCSEDFAKAASDLKLTGFKLVPVETDGAEPNLDSINRSLFKPDLWPRSNANIKGTLGAKKPVIKTEKLPSLPDAASLITKTFPEKSNILSGIIQPASVLSQTLNPG